MILGVWLSFNWPDVYYWSLSVGKPLPRRLKSQLVHAPNRICRWWMGQKDYSLQVRTPWRNSLEGNRDTDPAPDEFKPSGARVEAKGSDTRVSLQVGEEDVVVDIRVSARRVAREARF